MSMISKIIYLLLLLSGFTQVCNAQECTDANVLSIPGKWKPGAKGASDHSPAEMGKEKAIMEEVNQFMRSKLNWQPVGGDITYNNVYSLTGLDYRPAKIKKLTNTYNSYLFFQHYFCAGGKINREDFYIIFKVIFNDLPFTFSESFFVAQKDANGYDMGEDPGTDKYAFTASLPIERKNGVIDYIKDDFDGTGKSPGTIYRFRMLTRQSKLPYTVMSKKEYYEKWKVKYNKLIAGLESGRSKVTQLDKLSGNSSATELLNKEIDVYKGWIGKMNEILTSKTLEQLSKPAFSTEEWGNYFETNMNENKQPLFYVLKPNIEYYDEKLPRPSPQVITISFRYTMNEDKNGAQTYVDESFYKAIENSKLIDLLTDKLKPLVTK
jgi:hypothetical protein